MTLDYDLTQWQLWWEFNKARFLQLKRAIHSGAISTGFDDLSIGRGFKKNFKDTRAPNASDRRAIIKTLEKALLAKSSNRDIISSCMMGLAKIGGDPGMLVQLKKFLPSNNQELAETAALAMGVSALVEAAPDLLALAEDSDAGRKLVKRASVNYRTRSFAIYGLGLIAYEQRDTEFQSRLFESLRALASGGRSLRRDIKVAALSAMRLLRPAADAAGHELRKSMLNYLAKYMVDRKIFPLVRAHAITAAGNLLGTGTDAKIDDARLRDAMLAQMQKILRSRKHKTWIHQSAVLALGQMARPQDRSAIETLEWYTKSGKDMQARFFCSVSLGQIGGEQAREILLKSLQRRSTKKLSKPWLALGLAVLEHERRQGDPNYELDRTVADSVYKELRKARNRLFSAGFAIALGIMKYTDAGDLILEKAIAWKSDVEPAGYMAVALGLMNYQDAKEDINRIVETAVRKPLLLTQGSIALGLLGDKSISDKLIQRLENSRNTVAVHSALASALGFIGDRRSIPALSSLLENERLQPLSRAFSAVALGLVGDKEALPWSNKISENSNYRAKTETLTSGSGILDIL